MTLDADFVPDALDHEVLHDRVADPVRCELDGHHVGDIQLEDRLLLPEDAARVEPRFEHHAPPVLEVAQGARAQVFVGSAWGSRSPVRVESPLLGAEVTLEADRSLVVPAPEGFEVAVLVDRGSVLVHGRPVARGELGVVEAHRHPEGVHLRAGAQGARVLVLGGAPFEEEVVMWWNFIGRTHEDVEAAREACQAGAGGDPGRFGRVEGYEGPVARIPAPALPRVRLRARGNRGSAPAGGARGSGGSGFEGADAPPLS